MLPLKQPIVPLLMPELARHVRTLQAFKPKATPRGLDALSVNSLSEYPGRQPAVPQRGL
jgi:hypothetical protein